jgi:hypothetical protein
VTMRSLVEKAAYMSAFSSSLEAPGRFRRAGHRMRVG